MSDAVHRAFHIAWTAAVGTPGYDKDVWKAAERQLAQAGALEPDPNPMRYDTWEVSVRFYPAGGGPVRERRILNTHRAVLDAVGPAGKLDHVFQRAVLDVAAASDIATAHLFGYEDLRDLVRRMARGHRLPDRLEDVLREVCA